MVWLSKEAIKQANSRHSNEKLAIVFFSDFDFLKKKIVLFYKTKNGGFCSHFKDALK